MVAAHEPNVKLAYDVTTPLYAGRVEWALTPRPLCTNVSFLFAPAPLKGWRRFMARVMAALVRPLVMRRLRTQLKALQRVVEATEEGYAAP